MFEDQNGQEEILDDVQVEESQGEEMPEEVSTSEEPTEVGELPDDARDRTKREFEKLKAHNAELKRQLDQKQAIPSVLDYLTPQLPPVPQYMPQYQPYVPPVVPQPEPQLVDDQGYVNTDVLRQELELAKQAIRDAEEAKRSAIEAQSRISRFEQDNETKRVYQAYPELDPMSDVFNQDAYNLVKNELTSQIVNSGNRDAMRAAENMSKYFRKQAPANPQVLEQRRQVSVPGTTTQRQPTTDFEDLKRRSRNDPNAMLERLEASGY